MPHRFFHDKSLTLQKVQAALHPLLDWQVETTILSPNKPCHDPIVPYLEWFFKSIMS